MLWSLLNFLDAGSPCNSVAAADAIRRGRNALWSDQHESYARTMYAKVLRFVTHPKGTVGCSSSKLEQLIQSIKCTAYDTDISIDQAVSNAMEVNPDRISLPSPDATGVLDPASHLTGRRLKEFLAMPVDIPAPCRTNQDNPACHKVLDKDWPTVLKKLYKANMITFLEKSQVISEGRRLIKGGLFCVPHKETSDRLINDRRPANVRENRLNWCQLPSGPSLCQLILDQTQSIRASGDDLSNYFYLIKHLEAWQPRNAFGRPFRGALLPEAGLKPNVLYLPAFRVLCMGDTNGVDIAQATHEALLKKVGCLKPHQTIIHGQVFPASNTLEGLYIDDHLTFQVVRKKKLRDRGVLEDEIITKKARDRYDELKLPRSKKKSFDKCYNFKAWGTQVDSNLGIVSSPLEKLRSIEALTIALLFSGQASKKTLQKVVGLFIHPFMHRRECMCIFHHIYHHIEKLPEGKIAKLPQHIRDELLCATLLLPLAGTNARWPVSTQVSATDASSTGGGRAATLTSRPFAKVLFRFGEKRGEYCRLDWDKNAIPPPSDMELAPKALSETLLQHKWEVTQQKIYRRKEHINLLELDMLREEIKARVSSGRGSCRVVNLCDSRVVVGAYAKGRSSSCQMNFRLRSCAAWALAGDISITNLWVDTHSNPADYPSRGKQIPDELAPVDSGVSLLDPQILNQVKKRRAPAVQSFLEQETRRTATDALDDSVAVDPASHECPSEKTTAPRVVFREIFAGKAGLSRAMKSVAFVEVGSPVDFRYGKTPQDILDPDTFAELKSDAKAPNQLWHFGLPCCSFSIIQHSNGGTRRRNRPEGDNSLERERIGNLLLSRTLELIGILEEAGNHWTLENPQSSYAWLMPKMQEQLEGKDVHVACFDQCAFGLRLLGTDGRFGPCKKPTSLAGNFEHVKFLSRSCKCHNSHVHAIGGVRTKSGWRRRSELAGHYPARLRHSYAEMASRLIQ